MTLVLAGVALVLAGGGAALAAGRRARLSSGLALGGMISGSVLVLAGILMSALTGAGEETLRLDWTMPGGTLVLGLDPVAAFFLVVLFVIAPLAAIYGAGYLADAGRRRSLGGTWCFNSLLVAGMAVVILAADAVLFLIAWEVMSLAAYFLVTFEDDQREVREAGWTYLVATHVGTAFLLVFFLLAGRAAGSFEFAAIAAALPQAGAVRAWAFIAAVIGFGIKAGFVPLHVWLPEAHPAAPSHVSALMSGVMIKMGILGLLRALVMLGPPPTWWGWLLIGIGAVSGVTGVLFALAQHDLKRLLAYHSVENIGIITLGLGLGVLGAATASPGLAFFGFAGALFHIANHALFKSLLFLGAGSVLHATGTRDLDHLGGLFKSMRLTGITFLVAAVAISGLPPLNGFASELLIYLGAFIHGVTGRPAAAVPALATVIALALIGGLASACFAKAFGACFLGEPRSEHARHAHESAPAMVAPMVVLATLCALVALGAPWVVRLLGPAIAMLATALGVGGTEALADSAAHIEGLVVLGTGGLLTLVAAFVAVRWLLLRRREVRTGRTWGCGYPAPTSRMQYTASSFAQPLVELFAPVLRTEIRGEPAAGLFPDHASFATETGDVVTRRVFQPLFARGAWLLARLKFLQQGRVQLYVLYIAATLIALLIWKVVEL